MTSRDTADSAVTVAEDSNLFRVCALAYAAKGWRVFPVHYPENGGCSCRNPTCRDVGKHPLISRWPTQATTEAETIRRWWDIWPEANIGMVMGDGFVDIEHDPRHGGDISLPKLEQCIDALPDTVTWISGGGGEHRLFRVPIGAAVRNDTSICRDLLGVARDTSTGVDVRGNGGFAVMPPSRHELGTIYRFGNLHPDAVEVADLPTGWLDVLTARPAPAVSTTTDADPIPAGCRNDAMTRLAGILRRAGLTAGQMLPSLQTYNAERCQPPLDTREVERVARSVARYEPNQMTVAMVESWDKQFLLPHASTGIDAAAGLDLYPDLMPALIDGLLRQGETMNVIAASKSKKSFLILDLALSIVLGEPWLGAFPTRPGRVLLIDNELHPPTTMFRLRSILRARGIAREAIVGKLTIENLRGKLLDLPSILRNLAQHPAGSYQLVIVDAWYRTIPTGMDENDNGAVAGLYNAIDALAAQQGFAFALIHHTSKGNQSGKAIVDVGAGAGSQSRATDTHLTLRAHREADVAVLDGVVRSWPPLTPMCLRWQFPRWTPESALDPTDLDTGRSRRRTEPTEEAPAKRMSVDDLIAACLRPEPQSHAAVIEAAIAAGCSERRAERLLTVAMERGLIHHWPGDQLAIGVPPAGSTGEGPVTARDRVLALAQAEPDLSAMEIAQRCGVTPQYVRKLRRDGP